MSNISVSPDDDRNACLVQILGYTSLLSHCVMTIECDESHHKGESSLLGFYYRMVLSFNSFHDIDAFGKMY